MAAGMNGSQVLDALRRLSKMVSYIALGNLEKFNSVSELLSKFWSDYPQLDPVRPCEVIDLDELPRWSEWPSKVLGLSPWKIPTRNLNKVISEYNDDKFAKTLKHYRSLGSPNMEGYMASQKTRDMKVPVFWRGNLVAMSSQDQSLRSRQVIRSRMRRAIEKSASVVELGCGFGSQLWDLWHLYPDKEYWGGDISKNAIELGKDVLRDVPSIKVEEFNFYDSVYAILDKVKPPTVIFTVFGIEQLPSARHAISVLCQHRDLISDVFHFEPIHELYDATSLLGLMRKRYTEINDYNRDLLSCLRDREEIRIVKVEADIFGNPLHTMSMIHWRFKNS